MKKLSFLHFSDLHLGLNAQATLISKFKNDLFTDIRKVYGYMGGWDIVFFTGDFVQSGKKEEFEKVTLFLNEMWDVFKELECNPLFIGVPGNHDLERIENQYDSKLQYLLKWGDNLEFSSDYFWNSKNEYKTFIDERFNNYVEWHDSLNLPKPSNRVVKGYLPGDFAYIMDINDIKIGCVCLNSSYLQLNGNDFYEKLDIHSKQLYSLFQDQYIDWVKSVDVPLLITHQPPSWLSEKSKSNFHKEIYFPDSFVSHFCGHMHEPDLTQTESFISTSRKTQIAPSLFGLEKNGNDWSRIHGYFAGKFEFSGNYLNELIYPRIMVKSIDGTNRIAADNRFNLIEEKYVQFLVRSFEYQATEREEYSPKHINDNLLDNSNVKDNLSRTHYPLMDAHMKIRAVERKNAISKLKNERIVWISTRWGLEENYFIGTLIPEVEINPTNCFSIDCSDVKTINELYKIFDDTFQVSFNNFISIISHLENPLLVLERLNSEIPRYFIEEIQPGLDFALNLKVIVISENTPAGIDCVELLPLDLPSVKLYASGSDVDFDLNNQILLEKLHKITSGLPIYLDKRIEELKCCSLSDILEDQYDSNNIIIDEKNNELHRLIDELRDSGEESKRRAFELLKTLSTLENGETFSRIRHFMPTKTFYPDHVTTILR
jgi:predicted MPP superfamily phosphohydrolase